MEARLEDEDGVVHRLRAGWLTRTACWARVKDSLGLWILIPVRKPLSCLECLVSDDTDWRP